MNEPLLRELIDAHDGSRQTTSLQDLTNLLSNNATGGRATKRTASGDPSTERDAVSGSASHMTTRETMGGGGGGGDATTTMALAPVMDIWSLMLPQRKLARIWSALSLLRRLLRIVRPLVIVSFSNLAASAAAECWPWLAPENVDRHDRKWDESAELKEMPPYAYNDRRGSVVVCQPDTVDGLPYLHVSVHHGGNVRYDPTLQRLVFAEVFLCIVIAKVTEYIVVKAALASDALEFDRKWLRERQIETMEHLQTGGLLDALQEIKEAMQTKNRVVARLRRKQVRKELSGLQSHLSPPTNANQSSTEASPKAAGERTRKTRRARTSTQAGLELTKPFAERQAQYDRIILRAQLQREGRVLDDVRGLVLWGMVAPSEEYHKWFMGLKEGKRIAAMARPFGRSEDAKTSPRQPSPSRRAQQGVSPSHSARTASEAREAPGFACSRFGRHQKPSKRRATRKPAHR